LINLILKSLQSIGGPLGRKMIFDESGWWLHSAATEGYTCKYKMSKSL